MSDRAKPPVLEINDVHIYYGQSHAVQGANLRLDSGVISVIGRNGMGKTTLCKALIGLQPVSAGSIHLNGQSLAGLSPSQIARLGVGYVPQGRRLWPSLSVDEHLQLVATKGGAWSVERVYSVFPRLAERRRNGGSQLSGGEQQMLAIGRALLLNPKLLVMDEPTEGLAPVIVDQVTEMLIQLSQDGTIDVLVVEQNIGVACAVSEHVAIMVNGRINRVMDAVILAADTTLQQSLLGVGRHAHDETPPTPHEAAKAPSDKPKVSKVYTSNLGVPTRWSAPASVISLERAARTVSATPGRSTPQAAHTTQPDRSAVALCGSMDVNSREIKYLRDKLKTLGMRSILVDLSTSGKPSGADVPPNAVATYDPSGASGLFSGNNSDALIGMAKAFEHWVPGQRGISGFIAVGGSRTAALVVGGFRACSSDIPKIMISSLPVSCADHFANIGNLTWMSSSANINVTYPNGQSILDAAAQTCATFVHKNVAKSSSAGRLKPSLGITLSGASAACAETLLSGLEANYAVQIFDPVNAELMERSLAEGALDTVIDLTPSDIANKISAGLFSAGDQRLAAYGRLTLPFVGACAGLDGVTLGFDDAAGGSPSSQVTCRVDAYTMLRRTSAAEAEKIGQFIAERLNAIDAPVQFYLNEGGLSCRDQVGERFWAPDINQTLFATLERLVNQTDRRQLLRVPYHVESKEFAEVLLSSVANLPARRKVGER